MLGRLVHIGFDAVLISALLAGIRRSTGLTYVNAFIGFRGSLPNELGYLADLRWRMYQTRTYDVSDAEPMYSVRLILTPAQTRNVVVLLGVW